MIETMSKRWAGGSTRAWRRTRAAVLARDGYRCRLLLTGCTTRATCVHHTQAREIVGDDPAYLRASCRPCNQAIGDPTRHDPAPTPTRWWE